MGVCTICLSVYQFKHNPNWFYKLRRSFNFRCRKNSSFLTFMYVLKRLLASCVLTHFQPVKICSEQCRRRIPRLSFIFGAEITLVISIEGDLIKLKLPSYSCWCHHLLTTMLRSNHSNFNSWDFSHILLKLSTWIYKIFRKVLVQSKIYPPLQFFPYSN